MNKENNPPSNLGGEVTRTLTEQIIELMVDKQKGSGDYQIGFNQARTEMLNKIPEILSLIRGILEEEMGEYKSHSGSLGYQGMINGIHSIQTEIDQKRDRLLEKLK